MPKSKHVHRWREWLPCGHERTMFVACDKCEKQGIDSVRYLNAKATAEFRRQVKHGIKPRFRGNTLIGYVWKYGAGKQ